MVGGVLFTIFFREGDTPFLSQKGKFVLVSFLTNFMGKDTYLLNTLPCPLSPYFVDVVQPLAELKTDQAINLLRAKGRGTMTLTLVYTSIY